MANSLGLREWVKWVHGAEPAGQSDLTKLGRNLLGSLARNFAPNSQLWPMRESGQQIGLRLASQLPACYEQARDGASRQAALQVVLEGKTDADATAFGLVARFLFAAVATSAAIRIRQPGVACS